MNLDDFLQTLFQEGRILIGTAPEDTPDSDASTVLARAQRTAAFELAGPPLTHDAATALAAARVLYHAAWYLLSHEDPAAELEKRLVMPSAPTSPEQHLAADIVFRYVPALYRRSHALSAADPQTRLLAQLLRTWPLSGVLAELEDEPLTPVDFGGHAGLSLLYAERLAANPKTAWFPGEDEREHVELVWHDLGKDLSTLPAPVTSEESAATP